MMRRQTTYARVCLSCYNREETHSTQMTFALDSNDAAVVITGAIVACTLAILALVIVCDCIRVPRVASVLDRHSVVCDDDRLRTLV